MKTTLFLALFLTTLSALAADPNPEPPPSPTAEWVVEGYKAVGYQWVKQPDHCLKTTDLKQAVQYEAEIMRFQDWIARSNIPALCRQVSDNVTYPPSMGLPNPPASGLAFTVWAFRLEDGKWIKDENYSWTPTDLYASRVQSLAYAKKVNAVEGWCATTNAPESAAKPANQAAVYHGPLGTIGGYYGGGYYNNGGSSSDTYINLRGRRVAYPTEIDAATLQFDYGNP